MARAPDAEPGANVGTVNPAPVEPKPAETKAAEKKPPEPTLHRIVGGVPFFGADQTLHQPGELVRHDPDSAGINLEETDGSDHQGPAQVEIAPVAPSSPNASAPQDLPAGTIHTAGGSFVQQGGPETDGRAQEFVPLGGNVAAPGGQGNTAEEATKG